MQGRVSLGAFARGLTVLALLVVSLAACMTDGRSSGGSTAPCNLLTGHDAAEFLGGEVNRAEFSSWGQAAGEPLEADPALVDAVDARTCVYVAGEGRSDPSLVIQVDRGIFRSEDEFLQAVEGQVLPDGPGVAAVRIPRESGIDPDYESIVVLLNEAGDSFVLASNVDRSLTTLAERIASRYLE